MNIAQHLNRIVRQACLHGGVVFAGLVLSCSAQAAGNDVLRGTGAATGIFAGIYMHELGHAAAFRAAGAEHIRIRVPGSQCSLLCGETEFTWASAPSQSTSRVVSAAGLIASNLGAELLLRYESGARSAFGQGFVATNLYSNVAHVVTYYTKVRGQNGYPGNDIDAYELAGGNPHLLSVGLIAYSLYAVHRMHEKKIPIMFTSVHF